MVAVLTYRRDMHQRRRARGPYFPVDDDWKIAVRALMEKRGISQAEMARRVGASPAAITLLFKPDTVQSGLVAAVHRVLGLDPPGTTTITERDELRRRLDRVWRELSDVERELIVQVATSMRRPTH